MRWYHYVAYFFGGAFLANTLPHLGNGISGHPFQSPFASPPGEGLSSSTVNVLWGLFNLVVGYLLVCRVGSFDLRKTVSLFQQNHSIPSHEHRGARPSRRDRTERDHGPGRRQRLLCRGIARRLHQR